MELLPSSYQLLTNSFFFIQFQSVPNVYKFECIVLISIPIGSEFLLILLLVLLHGLHDLQHRAMMIIPLSITTMQVIMPSRM